MKTLRSIFTITVLHFVTVTVQAQEIFDAVKNNDRAKVKQLIERDAGEMNLKDKSGNTPLHNAAIMGSVPMAEFLLSMGADINAGNTQLATPLHVAIANKQDDVSKVLIEKGADLGKQDVGGNTPLHGTAFSNSNAIAELLITHGADLESKNGGNYTPLGALTRSTHSFEVTEVLVRKGANINARWTDGATPLNNAALYSDDKTIDLLLDHNADYDTSAENMRFMLSSTISRGHLRLFKTIVEKCGDALFINKADNTTLMRSALISGSLEIVKILQSKNIPLDVSANSTGATPLHSVVRDTDTLGMIEFLAENGADINARTNDGRSAYNIAEAYGNTKALDLILRLGGNSGPQNFPVLTGPYMGQDPPGNEPKRFAPRIVSPSHCTITLSADGNEMYWGNGYSILFSKIQNGQWTKPEYAPFSGKSDIEFYDDVPFISPDNKKLLFTSRRAIKSQNDNSKKENIWFVERTSTGWSELKPVNARVNAVSLHWQVSVSNSLTLYFGGSDQNGLGGSDLYYSKLVDEEYAKPVNLGPVINSKDGESMPYISPDESYIIFYKIVMQRPSLCISFNSKEGQWSEPQTIDRFRAGVCGIVSPYGKYLFCDNRWISAKFIEELRPKK